MSRFFVHLRAEAQGCIEVDVADGDLDYALEIARGEFISNLANYVCGVEVDEVEREEEA